MNINWKVTINKIANPTHRALFGLPTFHGVMTGCFRYQGAHITEMKQEGGNDVEMNHIVDAEGQLTKYNSKKTMTKKCTKKNKQRQLKKPFLYFFSSLLFVCELLPCKGT